MYCLRAKPTDVLIFSTASCATGRKREPRIAAAKAEEEEEEEEGEGEKQTGPGK